LIEWDELAKSIALWNKEDESSITSL